MVDERRRLQEHFVDAKKPCQHEWCPAACANVISHDATDDETLREDTWVERLKTFIDFDGTGKGFDIEFIKKIKNKLSIPLIISGGAGSTKQIYNLFKKTKVSGVALASLLHYNLIQGKKITKSDYEDEGNIEFMRTQNFNFKKFEVKTVKNILNNLNKI